jgi:hypothetical protein
MTSKALRYFLSACLVPITIGDDASSGTVELI